MLVPKSYADKHHISVGDIIRIKFTAPVLNNKAVDMKVLNIFQSVLESFILQYPGLHGELWRLVAEEESEPHPYD
ncbi:hypothetical protein AM231_02045 [Paenibacillus solani]|uniref:Uncharacterized protein n=1 Tax=Paenibacillus solani TaxID=1705565 RepID=A0A0M1P191_9BACL|nr:hypothetical protein AM231_02045 [Paenibacillus solani]